MCLYVCVHMCTHRKENFDDSNEELQGENEPRGFLHIREFNTLILQVIKLSEGMVKGLAQGDATSQWHSWTTEHSCPPYCFKSIP